MSIKLLSYKEYDFILNISNGSPNLILRLNSEDEKRGDWSWRGIVYFTEIKEFIKNCSSYYDAFYSEEFDRFREQYIEAYKKAQGYLSLL